MSREKKKAGIPHYYLGRQSNTYQEETTQQAILTVPDYQKIRLPEQNN